MAHIQTFYFNPFRECTYLLSDAQGMTAVIDCGAYTPSEQQRLQAYITRQNLTIKAHLLTHAHLDHCFGARFISDSYGISPLLSADDEYLFTRLEQQAAAFGCPLQDAPLADYQPLSARQTLQIGSLSLQVLPTPGHSAGSVCFYINNNLSEADPPILFSGDTLFQGGIGRTDLPGGDYTTLLRSLQQQIMPLPANTLVYPGHGYPTTIGEEKQTNPYLNN